MTALSSSRMPSAEAAPLPSGEHGAFAPGAGRRIALFLRNLPGLVRYLRAERPDALFAAMPTPNLLAVWARRLAGVPTRVLISERNTLSAMLGGSRRWRDRHLPPLLGRAYRLGGGVCAGSG